MTLWRYPRTQPLPRTSDGACARRPGTCSRRPGPGTRRSRPSRPRRTRVDGHPAVEVRGTATVAGQPRRVRSVHIYAYGAELVVDAVVEPDQAARVGREVVAPLLRSLRLRDPGAGA